MSETTTRPDKYPLVGGDDPLASSVQGADPYVCSPVSAYALERNVLALCDEPMSRFDSKVHLHGQTGQMYLDAQLAVQDKPVTSLLPLRLGPLKMSLDSIAASDSWLLARHPVFYADRHGEVHIDFPGLAGFTIDAMGALLGRAVNPY